MHLADPGCGARGAGVDASCPGLQTCSAAGTWRGWGERVSGGEGGAPHGSPGLGGTRAPLREGAGLDWPLQTRNPRPAGQEQPISQRPN